MIICIMILFVAGGFLWTAIPVHFLSEIEPEEVGKIYVFNENNGDEFEVTNSDDINNIVNSIKQIIFKRDNFGPEVPYWYRLTFIDENGKEIETLGIQNSRILQKDVTEKWSFCYRCDGELGIVGDCLESLEAVEFPDYKKDQGFPYD